MNKYDILTEEVLTSILGELRGPYFSVDAHRNDSSPILVIIYRERYGML